MWNPFRRSPPPPPLEEALARLPAGEARYVLVDTELTGLDERCDTILSLGGIRAPAGRLDIGATFYREIRPSVALDHRSIVVHGITPSDVRDGPPLGQALEEFLGFCGGDILVGHFVGIDLFFLRKAIAEIPRLALPNPAIDTWFLYEWMRCREPQRGDFRIPAVKDPRLFEIARALGVGLSGAHNALRDAFTTGLVFQRLLRRAADWGLLTVGDLLRAGDPGSPMHDDHNGVAPPFG